MVSKHSPVLHGGKGLLVGDVIHEQEAHGSAVVGCGDCINHSQVDSWARAMCDAAEPESGQGGSGLGLPLAGPRGHRLGPGKFLCMKGKEDDVASTNSSKKVCPPHSSQRAPVST